MNACACILLLPGPFVAAAKANETAFVFPRAHFKST
jgi:hypothetical protein